MKLDPFRTVINPEIALSLFFHPGLMLLFVFISLKLDVEIFSECLRELVDDVFFDGI